MTFLAKHFSVDGKIITGRGCGRIQGGSWADPGETSLEASDPGGVCWSVWQHGTLSDVTHVGNSGCACLLQGKRGQHHLTESEKSRPSHMNEMMT